MTAPTATPRSIHQLRSYDGPLYVANNTMNKITCHERLGDKRVDFELDPKGEPDSMMVLPKLALDVRGIQKLWMAGDITVSTDDAFQNQISLLMNQNLRAPEDRVAQIMGAAGEENPPAVSIEQSSTNNHLVVRPCQVCGHVDSVSGVIDRGQVTLTLREANDGKVPLCAAHEGQRRE
ncbi:MAG TPA: hypothetical protein PKL71_05430, partial [Marmoricola sp.]|nr:hypothetical protein [Marmoricola sp.]